MTITISGTVGVDFDVTESDDALSTGTIVQNHTVEDAIKNLTLESDDLPSSISGTVGATAFDLDLNDVHDQAGAGFAVSVVRNQSVDYTSIKSIVFHNKSTVNNLRIGSPAADSFFTWNTTSDFIEIEPGGAMTFVYSTPKVVSTTGKINILASGATTPFEIYILGK